MKEKKEKDDSLIVRKITNFTMFVIIIVLILLTHSCSNIGKINNLVPTGNIDIFDITINNECPKCDCKNNENNKVDNNIKKESKEEDIEPAFEEEKATIYDKDGDYANLTKLNIFTNPAYEFRSIIAPTSSNVYQFVVRNNNDFNIKYNITMVEDNKYDINMLYRLKLAGRYIKGNDIDWVDYDSLQLEDLLLAANSKDVYQLEWKWFESENDTNVGKIAGDYSLKISFDGVEV